MVETISEVKENMEPVLASNLFNIIPPSPRLKLSVILPVRNESENLIQTLDALRNQRDSAGLRVPYSHYEV